MIKDLDSNGLFQAQTLGILNFELFNLLLLLANIVTAIVIIRRGADPWLGAGIMILIASHAFIGQKIAPDSLTSGSILMVNILVVYVGFRIFDNLSLARAMGFVISYYILTKVFKK